MPSSRSSPAPDLSPPAPGATRVLDGLAFSLWLPAAVAAAVCASVGGALGASEVPRWAILAASGSFIVYGVDRLRDLERDRATSPRRSAFVERNALGFRVALVLAALIGLSAGAGASPPAVLLCAGLGGLGLLHRRLKQVPAFKSLYVAFAWTGVCVGLPMLATTTPRPVGPALWAASILFPTFWANLVASNLRDDEAGLSPAPALRAARVVVFTAAALALWAPTPVAPLGWVAFMEGCALLRFRPTEHYGHLVVDGALLVGALLTLAHPAAS